MAKSSSSTKRTGSSGGTRGSAKTDEAKPSSSNKSTGTSGGTKKSAKTGGAKPKPPGKRLLKRRADKVKREGTTNRLDGIQKSKIKSLTRAEKQAFKADVKRYNEIHQRLSFEDRKQVTRLEKAGLSGNGVFFALKRLDEKRVGKGFNG